MCPVAHRTTASRSRCSRRGRMARGRRRLIHHRAAPLDALRRQFQMPVALQRTFRQADRLVDQAFAQAGGDRIAERWVVDSRARRSLGSALEAGFDVRLVDPCAATRWSAAVTSHPCQPAARSSRRTAGTGNGCRSAPGSPRDGTARRTPAGRCTPAPRSNHRTATHASPGCRRQRRRRSTAKPWFWLVISTLPVARSFTGWLAPRWPRSSL